MSQVDFAIDMAKKGHCLRSWKAGQKHPAALGMGGSTGRGSTGP